MTQDEIIRMAREAGFEYAVDNERWYRFADLVAAHEREQEMKAAEKAIYVAIGLEREACAKVCDAVLGENNVSAAIRARGEND